MKTTVTAEYTQLDRNVLLTCIEKFIASLQNSEVSFIGANSVSVFVSKNLVANPQPDFNIMLDTSDLKLHITFNPNLDHLITPAMCSDIADIMQNSAAGIDHPGKNLKESLQLYLDEQRRLGNLPKKPEVQT